MSQGVSLGVKKVISFIDKEIELVQVRLKTLEQTRKDILAKFEIDEEEDDDSAEESPTVTKKPEPIPTKPTEKKKGPLSDEEKRKIVTLRDGGQSVESICNTLGRSRYLIVKHLNEVGGVVEKDDDKVDQNRELSQTEKLRINQLINSETPIGVICNQLNLSVEAVSTHWCQMYKRRMVNFDCPEECKS